MASPYACFYNNIQKIQMYFQEKHLSSHLAIFVKIFGIFPEVNLWISCFLIQGYLKENVK